MEKYSVQARDDLTHAHDAVTFLVSAPPQVAKIMEETANEAVRKAQDAYDKILLDISNRLDMLMHSSA